MEYGPLGVPTRVRGVGATALVTIPVADRVLVAVSATAAAWVVTVGAAGPIQSSVLIARSSIQMPEGWPPVMLSTMPKPAPRTEFELTTGLTEAVGEVDSGLLNSLATGF